MKYDTFIFERYELDAGTRTASFAYSYQDGPAFTETLVLPEGLAVSESPELDRALFALHLLLGVSYWKAYCAPKIVVKSGSLDADQAHFWNTLYTKGLGQFFYENNLPPVGLVHFEARVALQKGPGTASCDSADEAVARSTSRDGSAKTGPATNTLVPMGGGKDSLVTIELLKSLGINFQTYTLGRHELIEDQRAKIDAPHFTIIRAIDPQLFALNDADAYNGHVPITAVYTFTALVVAILNNNSHIAISSERSANEGNVEYQGETINHQWSKSAEAEALVRDYIHAYVTPNVTTFSLLRPLSELDIAKRFATHTEWLPLFTSCNRNFAINKTTKKRWCGECPKCAFVFAMLAPFVSKTELVNTFGKNLFADETLLPLYQELLGLKNFKPFECVGTPNEVRAAFTLASRNAEYTNDTIMRFVTEHGTLADEQTIAAVLTPSTEHAIPKDFQSYLHE
jgi:hypothetical protein